MILRNPSHRLKPSASGLIKPRLCLPGREGQAVHLHEAALMVRHARSELGLCSSGLVCVLAREGVWRRALGECLHEPPQLRYWGVVRRRSSLHGPRLVPRSGARGMAFVELSPDEASEILAIHDLR
jgi:hypothetical protein